MYGCYCYFGKGKRDIYKNGCFFLLLVLLNGFKEFLRLFKYFIINLVFLVYYKKLRW